jgi:hypothetical protein
MLASPRLYLDIFFQILWEIITIIFPTPFFMVPVAAGFKPLTH